MGNTFTQPIVKSDVYFRDDLPLLDHAKDKIIAITGCTGGMGRLVAETCGRHGATIIMLNRPSSRATDVYNHCRNTIKEGKFVHIDCDLTSFESVRQAADNIRNQFGESGVDILFNNAGIMAFRDQPTDDGISFLHNLSHKRNVLQTKFEFVTFKIQINRFRDPNADEPSIPFFTHARDFPAASESCRPAGRRSRCQPYLYGALFW